MRPNPTWKAGRRRERRRGGRDFAKEMRFRVQAQVRPPALILSCGGSHHPQAISCLLWHPGNQALRTFARSNSQGLVPGRHHIAGLTPVVCSGFVAPTGSIKAKHVVRRASTSGRIDHEQTPNPKDRFVRPRRNRRQAALRFEVCDEDRV